MDVIQAKHISTTATGTDVLSLLKRCLSLKENSRFTCEVDALHRSNSSFIYFTADMSTHYLKKKKMSTEIMRNKT